MNENLQPPLPPKQPQSSLWRKLFAPVVLVLVFFGKLKTLFLFLLKFKFFAFFIKTGSTMLFSIWIYAYGLGWPFAVGFVLLIFVHECGHLVAARRCGLKVGLPVFIPFMGAMIALKEAPRNAWIEAQVGIGGPILGTAGALICLVVYQLFPYPLFLALAYSGFWLNLFNLIPIIPLDGGRIVTAISPWLWLVGIVVLVPILFYSSFNLFVILIVGLSLPRVFSLFRKRTDTEQRFFDLTGSQRIWMSIQYFGLAAVLAYLMQSTQHKITVLQ